MEGTGTRARNGTGRGRGASAPAARPVASAPSPLDIVRTRSLSSLVDTVERRSTLAWQQLWRDNMPLITLMAALTALWAIRNRSMYEPFYGPIWPAALVGGLAGGVIGSFTEDSGPLLLIGAVLMLVGVSAYLLGRPDSETPGEAPGVGVKDDPESVAG